MMLFPNWLEISFSAVAVNYVVFRARILQASGLTGHHAHNSPLRLSVLFAVHLFNWNQLMYVATDCLNPTIIKS